MTRHEPDLIATDDEKNGIAGATICFTPQPSSCGSPRSTPAPLMNSVETVEDIGNVDGLTSDGKEKSSFDDDANEFEMLDRDGSKASIEVEDLDVDDEDVDNILKSKADSMKTFGDVDDHALKELFMSPPSSLPSLNDDAVAGDGGEAKKLPVTASLMNEYSLQYLDGAPFNRMIKSMLSHMAKLGQQDAASIEGDVSKDASSLKIDDTPISTRKNLRTFWENRELGKTTNYTIEASEAANSVDETDRQSSSNHVTSLEGFSPEPKSQLLSSVMTMIWDRKSFACLLVTFVVIIAAALYFSAFIEEKKLSEQKVAKLNEDVLKLVENVRTKELIIADIQQKNLSNQERLSVAFEENNLLQVRVSKLNKNLYESEDECHNKMKVLKEENDHLYALLDKKNEEENSNGTLWNAIAMFGAEKAVSMTF